MMTAGSTIMERNMLFKAAPDSLVNRGKWRSESRFARFGPLISMVWLVWVFGPVWSGGDPAFRGWLWPTLASVVVFLVFYARAFTCPRREMVWHVLAIAALGGVLTPFNPFAQCYLIYACSFAAYCGAPKLSLRIIVSLLALYSGEWFILHLPWIYLFNGLMIALMVGVIGVFQRVEGDRRAELRLSHDEVRRLAATAERERIGRDLHDLLGHTLSLVAVKSELAKRLLDRDPVAARREIAEVERVAREALSQVRNAVTGIRAAGLAAELASAKLLLESAGVVFDYRPPALALPEQVETTLALVLREAVTNIQRHAHATRAEVSVEHERDRAILRVHDNGRGGIGAHGNGLTGMRERIEALGGSLAIRSERGRGTELAIALPLREVEPAASPKAARGSAPAATLGHQLKHA